VTATTQEEVLSGILPRINIDKITLTSPDENILNISLDLTIKETLDDSFFGSWFEDININKYILVDVVQSTDASITEALSYSNDMIQLCNVRRQKQINIKDTRTKAFAYITNNTKVSSLLKLLEDGTTTQTLSINNTKNKITDYTAYTNNDGDKIYEVPYKVQFSIDKQPEHLAYFAVCSIDLDSLCADLKIDYDIAESFEENGRVISEIVINESAVVSESFVYADKNGVVWSGPVHQNSQGIWRSGDDETPDSINLDRIVVTNTKVQDFRRFNRIERLMVDFNDNEKYSLLSQKQAENITKIQSTDYKPDRYSAEFTELFSSTDANGNAKFLFGVNFINVLKNYSKFSKLLDTNNDTFKEESIRETRILDLKLFRRRIKNSSQKPYEKQNPEQPDELILQTKDISWRNFVDINNKTASIKEADILTQSANNFIRFFTGVDKSFKQLTDGVYQYYIEFEIEDGINDFVRTKLQELETAKQLLVEYYNKISKPTMKKFITENSNPHIDSPNEYSQNSLVMDYGYDIVSNKLSPQLVSKLIREYGSFTSPSAPWNACNIIFSYILDIFSAEISTDEDRKKISDSLFEMLNPNATNPQIVQRTIEMFEYFITNISKTFDISLETISLSGPASTSSSKPVKSFKVTKIFDSVADTSIVKSFGIDYLSNTVSQPSGDDGLLTITSIGMERRIQNEISKYFTTQDPNISFPTALDNSDSIKYSYLSPTRIDFPGKSTILTRLSSSQDDSKARNIDYFFQDNSFTKAVSLQADILNFKLDVTGKNRFLMESGKEDTQQQLTPARLRGVASLQQKVASNKMKEVFAEYSSTTFQKYSVSADRNVPGSVNDTAIINFMSSLSADALRAKQASGYKRRSTGSGFIPNYVEDDYIKKLSSVVTTNTIISNNLVTGFRRVFPQQFLGNIPIQLRAIIFRPQELQSDIRASLTNTDNSYKINTENKARNYFYFEMLTEIQYLESFETNEAGEESTITPRWRTLTKQFIDGLQRQKEILCRIRSFSNQNIGIKSNTEVEERCYDKYFILRTTSPAVPPRTITPFDDNPLVGRFLDTIRINVPGIQIKEKVDFTRSLVVKTPSIQIIKTDETGKTQLLEIKDVRNIVSRDVSAVQAIRVGDSTLPASVKAAVNVSSVAFQGANISNNVRSSNFVPNTNIRATGRKI
jgi:hypothetical protein